MSTDEDFVRSLRHQVELLAPDIPIDTPSVVPGARRMRRRSRAATALAMVGLAGATGVVLGLGPGFERAAPAEQSETWEPPAWFAEQRRERAEYTRTVGSCLEALGWNVTISPDGTVGASRNGAQGEDPGTRLDDIRRCNEDNGYPYGDALPHLTADEAQAAHSMDVDSWRCWQHEGYDLEPPPPLAEYLDKGNDVGWDAFRASGLPADELLAICPLRWVR